MNNKKKQHKSWWRQNLKWGLLLSAFAILTLLFFRSKSGEAVANISQAYMDSDLFNNALEKVMSHEKAMTVLGEIGHIDKLSILEGDVQYSNESTHVHATISIKGSKGKAKMDVVAQKEHEQWNYETLQLRITHPKDQQQTISITSLQNVEYEALTDAEKFVLACHKNPALKAYSFDFPVGKPAAKGYYNAQKFQENQHLGDDWNGVRGGNTDLGDPIYSIANGYVCFAEDIGGGWGNVIRILHLHKDTLYESIYAHTDTLLVTKGDYVKKGVQIATIGTADGTYLAHLHLEIRDSIAMNIGPGYSIDTRGYLDPTLFINEH